MPQLTGVPAFVHVAEQRSFRAAARALGVTPTAVSKAVSRLEEALGAPLLYRTSRVVTLTPEGQLYLRHCREALDRLQAGEDLLVRSGQVAQGTLKVSASFVLGRILVENLHRLLSRYPRLRVHLSFSDHEVNLAVEEVDVALRIGALHDSPLVRRSLGSTRWVTVASPSYLARASEPRDYTELKEHACLRFARPAGGVADWQFVPAAGAEPVAFRTESALLIDQGDLLVHAARSGLGVAQVFDFMVDEPLRRGELVEVLRHQAAPGPPLHALTSPGRQRRPKVRAFMEFLDEVLRRPGA